MKKLFFALILIAIGIVSWKTFQPKIVPYYKQLTKERVGLEQNLQPTDQTNAHFVGSAKCQECHKENFKSWSHSLHSKMIQDIRKNPNVICQKMRTLTKAMPFIQ